MGKKSKVAKPAKPAPPTAAEFKNDPSLKFNPYRWGEVVYSDAHKTEVRFVRYVDDGVIVGSLNGIAELDGAVARLDVRRVTARQ